MIKLSGEGKYPRGDCDQANRGVQVYDMETCSGI